MERSDKAEATGKMVIAIASVVVIFFFVKLITPTVTGRFGIDENYFVTGMRSILSIVVFVALGGARWLRPDLKAVGHAWRFMGYIIILQLLLGLFSAFAQVGSLSDAELAALDDDVLNANLAYISGLCLLIGINEEVMFRGLCLGGLLARLGDKRSGIIASCVISSLIFGAFHVITSVDPANLLSMAQGLMKTLQSGLFGFVLCAPVIEDHNLGGSITFHAYNDWIVMVGYVFTALPEGTTYVTDNPQLAMAVIGIYAFMCLLFVPKMIQTIRRLKKLEEPQLGPFMREEAQAPSGAHFA